MVNKNELKSRGGKWLGAARSWIQWNCLNGDVVTWGSDDLLMFRTGRITVRHIEDLAAEVAAAAIQEYEEKRLIDEKTDKLLDAIMKGDKHEDVHT